MTNKKIQTNLAHWWFLMVQLKNWVIKADFVADSGLIRIQLFLYSWVINLDHGLIKRQVAGLLLAQIKSQHKEDLLVWI